MAASELGIDIGEAIDAAAMRPPPSPTVS